MNYQISSVKALALGVTLISSGCATVPNDAPKFQLQNTPENGANIYIYRIEAYPSKRAATVKINGENVYKSLNNTYSVINVPSGSHNIKVSWPLDTLAKSLNFQIDVGDNKDYFLKMTGEYENETSKIPNSHSVVSYEGGIRKRLISFFEAGMIPKQDAVSELQKCCVYLSPLN